MGIATMTGFFKRTRMLCAMVLSAGVFAMAMPVSAQELAPEHIAIARKYIELTDRAAVYETTLVETAIQSMRLIVQQNPELIEPVNTAIESILEEYRGRKGELLDQFARVYAVRFSMEELQEIVAFYETPVGAKLAAASGDVNSDLQRVLAVFESNLKQEFFAKVRAKLREAGVEI